MSEPTPDALHHRRVVTGATDDGRSYVVSDGPAPVTMRSEPFSLAETWRFASAPDTTTLDETVDSEAALEPVDGQVLIRFCHFAPENQDVSWDEALTSIGGEDAISDDGRPAGFHQTQTIDHITVVSGEIYCVLDDGEVLLRAGDTIVQRGTPHAWSNRSADDCVVLTVQVGLREAEER
jgi:mannose-6-phosphate isomerase-like protein (cupin superfamily)